MHGFKQYALNNKWVVLVIILVVGVIGMRMISKASRKDVIEDKRPGPGIIADSIKDPTRIVDGYDWLSVGSLNISEFDRAQIKAALLKISLESSIINGNALFEPRASIAEYTGYVDRFYQRPENVKVPVFFALKIADMVKGGSAEVAVQGYKQLVIDKLKRAGLLE